MLSKEQIIPKEIRRCVKLDSTLDFTLRALVCLCIKKNVQEISTSVLTAEFHDYILQGYQIHKHVMQYIKVDNNCGYEKDMPRNSTTILGSYINANSRSPVSHHLLSWSSFDT